MFRQNWLTSTLGLALALGVTTGCSLLNSEWHVKTPSMDITPNIKLQPGDSLTEARDKVRELLKTASQGPIVVELASGTYRLKEPLMFEEADSGTADVPVIYRSAPDATVVITGGQDVQGLEPLTDPVLLSRLPEESRSRVMVADLWGQGIKELGQLGVKGQAKGTPLPESELFYDDKPMTLSRWPKTGFKGALSKDGNEKVVLDLGGRSERWKNEVDPWIMAYWHHDWAELYEPIVGWGEKKDEILRNPKIKPPYGLTPERTRCYVLNLFSELSEPGDYVFDRTNGKLYFIPPYEGGRATVSLATNLVKFRNAHHIALEGITFECTRGTLVVLENASHIKVTGCVLRNSAQMGLSGSGSFNEVYGCDVYDTGEGGMSLYGGDRRTLTNGNNVFDNNHVHDYSRRARTYRTGIRVDGCGNCMSHNLIHHGPHMAMASGGNNHIVEYNEIHNAVYESGDAGAFYVGRDWTQRGNILRYNYFHHIKGSSSYGGMTIYLDDQHSGYTIYGNLFEDCNQAVFIGGGCDNIVDNNVFINCWKAGHLDNRGMGWQKKATLNPDDTLQKNFRAMPVDSPAWKKAYPTLAGLLNDDPGVPKRNVFRRNVSAGGTWYDINQSTIQYQTVEKNVVHDEEEDWIQLVKNEQGQPKQLIFKDENELKDIGYEPIPVEKMGLYRDPRRASWPIRRTIEPVSIPSLKAINAAKEEALKQRRAAMPTLVVPQKKAVDGAEIVLGHNYSGKAVQNPAKARISHDGKNLQVVVDAYLPETRNLATVWGKGEATELAIMASDGANADIYVFRGFTDGSFETFKLVNGKRTEMPKLNQVKFQTAVAAAAWHAEWTVPLDIIGLAVGDRARANVTVHRTATKEFVMWRPTYGDSTNCDSVGFWELTR